MDTVENFESTNKVAALPMGSKIICCNVGRGHDPTRSAGSNQMVALSPGRLLKRQRGAMGWGVKGEGPLLTLSPASLQKPEKGNVVEEKEMRGHIIVA